MAINLNHSDDLLHSEVWMSEEWRNKEQCAHYSRETARTCQGVHLSLQLFGSFMAHQCVASVIVFRRSVNPQWLYLPATLIPAYNILIFPSTLKIQPTISIANEVRNELEGQHLAQCMYEQSQPLDSSKLEARHIQIFTIMCVQLLKSIRSDQNVKKMV